MAESPSKDIRKPAGTVASQIPLNWHLHLENAFSNNPRKARLAFSYSPPAWKSRQPAPFLTAAPLRSRPAGGVCSPSMSVFPNSGRPCVENPESAPAADTLKGLVWPFAADIQQGISAAVTGGRETASPDAVIARQDKARAAYPP